MVANNIAKLENLSKIKLKEYEEVRTKLGAIRTLEQKVLLDEKQLRESVEHLEKENAQLHRQLMGKIDTDNIKAEFELLKDTGKGQALLQEKLLYLQGRIAIEKRIESELKERQKEAAPLMNARV